MSTQTSAPQHVLLSLNDQRCSGFVCGGTAYIQGFPSNARLLNVHNKDAKVPTDYVLRSFIKVNLRERATSRIPQHWLEATAGEDLQSSSSMRMRMPFTRPEEEDVDSGSERATRAKDYGLQRVCLGVDFRRLRFAWGGLTDFPAGVKPK